MRWRSTLWPSAQHGKVAIGQVALWGKVIEHERGFRATFAYPIELRLDVQAASFLEIANCGRLAHRLESAYGVPVSVPGSARATQQGLTFHTDSGM